MKKVLEKLIYSSARRGSALIMTVVLTVLLALIGALFVMGARLDKMATASISENKELEAGVDAVVEKISQELVDDVPGMPGAEYYDYVGPGDPWLANLEPYQLGSDYKWQRISDIYGRFDANDLPAEIIREFQDTVSEPVRADADGDGVADSRWIVLPDITTAKGKPIFAAVRIIDHGAMLNVNTAYKFDPATADGSSQMQINLAGLSERGASNIINDLDDERFGLEPLPHLLDNYIRDVVWALGDPDGLYTPFDISDELKLRNRYVINIRDVKTRISELWTKAFDWGLYVPRTTNSQLTDPNGWFWRTNYGFVQDPCNAEVYDYRHIVTTYNFDRLIKPDGEKMVNVNAVSVDDVNDLYQALYDGITGLSEPNRIPIAAQLAVNIIDFRDGDAVVTTFSPDGKTYYGFEAQPFISEIGCKINISDPNNNEYAVELYNPFNIPVPLEEFTLYVYDRTGTTKDSISLAGKTIGANGYLVITNDLTAFTIDPNATTLEDLNFKLSDNYVDTNDDWQYEICDNYDLTLKRTVDTADGTTTIEVDKQKTNYQWFIGAPEVGEKYAQRDDDNWHVIYPIDSDDRAAATASGSLGADNSFAFDPNDANYSNYNLAIANQDFVTIGDIALPLYIGHGEGANSTVGEKLDAQPLEKNIRLDLTNPAFRNIFRHLTVIDPADHDLPQTETRVKGRININTAPWFVIAQLPWVQYADPNLFGRAQAICNHRITTGPYESIADLMQVPEMHLAPDGLNNPTVFDDPKGPDLTPDTARDDFEERNVIFSRLSNLVTVRSDVFCAYILVRLGTDGPQKRVMVILDRSDVSSSSDKVKIVAYHPVPDPR